MKKINVTLIMFALVIAVNLLANVAQAKPYIPTVTCPDLQQFYFFDGQILDIGGESWSVLYHVDGKPVNANFSLGYVTWPESEYNTDHNAIQLYYYYVDNNEPVCSYRYSQPFYDKGLLHEFQITLIRDEYGNCNYLCSNPKEPGSYQCKTKSFVRQLSTCKTM